MPDYTGISDEVLAENTKKGDDSAYQALMLRYINHIYNFARQYAKTDEEAEDIVQDSFYKAWRHIGRFEKGRTFKPWLFTITRNTALDYVKKKRAMSFSELDEANAEMSFADTLHDPEPLPQELFDRALATGEIDKALGTLHPDHRAVLVMHYREDMTFEEIAKIMKKPMNTVKSWHRRSLLKIRELFAHQR